MPSIENYRTVGVRHIVGCARDPLGGIGERYAASSGRLQHAADLAPASSGSPIRGVRSRLSGTHPGQPDRRADIDMLAAKVDAGAARHPPSSSSERSLFAATSTGAVRADRMSDRALASAGPEFQAGPRISGALRTSVARLAWRALRRARGMTRDPQAIAASGRGPAELIDLVDRGVNRFHFYTMNRATWLRGLPFCWVWRPNPE